MLEVSRETTFFSSLFDFHQLLYTCIADLENVILGRGLTADRQQAHDIRLVDNAETWVVSPDIALPVGVIRDITSWDRDRIIIAQRRKGTGRGITEL